MTPRPTNLEALLKHPGLWRGRQQHSNRETLSTGHAALDALLPEAGWPLGALTEIMSLQQGIGEFSLLLPALYSLTQQQQWIALVAPPHIPYAPALANAGIALDRLLIVSPEDSENAFWSAEQLLRSGVFSAVILWSSGNSDDRQQRRLQLAAEQGKAFGVCYRPHRTAKTASPAGLRMVLQSHRQSLQIDIIKNRGGRLHSINFGAAQTQKNTASVLHPFSPPSNSPQSPSLQSKHGPHSKQQQPG